MENFNEQKSYRPIPAPRSGERNAWMLAFLIFVIWFFMRMSGQKVPGSVTIFLILFVVVALLISLSNWTERQTVLQLDQQGILFKNGLRKVSLKWDEIENVKVIPAVWGKRVRVFGQGKQFDFHTLGEVKYRGMVRAHTGFAEGEEIIRLIVLRSQLSIAEGLDNTISYIRQH